MSILDKKHILTISLDTRAIEVKEKIKFYNTDRNIANLYVRFKKKNDNDVEVELKPTDLTGLTLKLTVVKPKTIQTKEMIGTLTNELGYDYAIYKFELPLEFTDQVGMVAGEFELTDNIENGESITIDPFSYEIKPSKLTGLNAEIIANPDLPILKSLMQDVKETMIELTKEVQKVNYIDNVNITDVNTYSNKKIEEKFSEVDAQFNTIANGLKLVTGENNTLKLMLGNVVLSTVTISGGNVEPTYIVTNNLTNATNSNNASSVVKNGSYTATISANSGYKLDSVIVKMDNVDITTTVYANGNINISSVTGNIVITVTTIIDTTNNIVGSIDTSKNITLTGLSAGTYTLKYEDETGIISDFDVVATMEV